MTVGPSPFPGGGIGVARRMSTNNRIRVLTGLLVLGSFGWATARDRADADEPRGPGSPSADAPAANERYLLLIDGRVIKGVITEEGPEFLVNQGIGVMRFKKQKAEGAFNSMRDAYLYRVQQLPERDAEERIKLARWCLNFHLKAEAKEQLERVLELNSKHPQARTMMFSMNQAAALIAQRRRDPEVKQTGAETMSEDRPKALDSAVLERAHRGLNIVGAPVIFDLPTPLAIKRYNEFCRFVQPVLQHYCAKCHDGNYEGQFQLVPIKGRGDLTVESVRANLDATLRLIDQENPSKSDLLTSTLRAHGRGPRPRSIFPGSNDLTYRILATWVNSLQNPKTGADAKRVPEGRAEQGSNEAFASGRGRATDESPEAMMSALASQGRRPVPGGVVGGAIPQPAKLVPGADASRSAYKPGRSRRFPVAVCSDGQDARVAAPDDRAGRRRETVAQQYPATGHARRRGRAGRQIAARRWQYRRKTEGRRQGGRSQEAAEDRPDAARTARS